MDNEMTVIVKDDAAEAPALSAEEIQGLMKDTLVKHEAEKEAEAKAEKEAADALEAHDKEIADAAVAEFKLGLEPKWEGGYQVNQINIKNKTVLGFADEDSRAFMHWLKTGDNIAAKAALQEGTSSEGGYLVPDDFYSGIISKKKEISWPRAAGARVFPTSRDVLQVPVEGTSMTKLVVTAEEGAVDENEPVWDQVSLTVYNFTKLIKMSKELEQDEDANLASWLTDQIGIAAGLAENYYVAIGTGSAQPQGVFVGGTAGLTVDSADDITADEIPELFGKLGEAYIDSPAAGVLMNRSTESHLRKIFSTSMFAFQPNTDRAVGERHWNRLYGLPVFTDSNCAAIATTAKTVCVGDFSFYGIAERGGVEISRNPYLYEANGQIGLFATHRWGGAVLQAEAFQYITQA